MNRSLGVYLQDETARVGTLLFSASGNREASAFAYSDEWLSNPDRYAVDPELPLVSGTQFPGKGSGGRTSAFHGCLADSEPDGWGKVVINRDRAKRRKDAADLGNAVDPAPATSLDYLLAVDDVSRIGALRLRDESGVFQRASAARRRSTPPLVHLADLIDASRAVETHTETAADLRYLRGHGTSLGGMRPKASLVDADGALCIAKFPSVSDERAVTKGEVLALRVAARAGIDAAVARVVMSGTVPVALVRRFDRNGDRRVGYASARTLMTVKDEDDHTYTEIVDAIRTSGSAVSADLRELWKRMVLNVLITNVDDHLNNHGFLYGGAGRWRLSPAFDVNPFPDKAHTLKTWISEEAGPEASIQAALDAARLFGLNARGAREALAEVDAAVGAWREVARSPEVGMTTAEANQFAQAFEHRERKIASGAIASRVAASAPNISEPVERADKTASDPPSP